MPSVIPQIMVIPNAGGDIIFVDFFSNWVLWAILGAVVIVLLIALAARLAGLPQSRLTTIMIYDRREGSSTIWSGSDI